MPRPAKELQPRQSCERVLRRPAPTAINMRRRRWNKCLLRCAEWVTGQRIQRRAGKLLEIDRLSSYISSEPGLGRRGARQRSGIKTSKNWFIGLGNGWAVLESRGTGGCVLTPTPSMTVTAPASQRSPAPGPPIPKRTQTPHCRRPQQQYLHFRTASSSAAVPADSLRSLCGSVSLARWW